MSLLAIGGLASLVVAAAVAWLLVPRVAMASARAAVRRHGIELPDFGAVRAAADADTVVVDLHGVITTGELSVIAIDPVEPDHERNLRWFAGALGHASDHRVARAVSRLAGHGHLSNVLELPGCGITGSVDRHPVRVGSPDWLRIPPPETWWTAVGVEVDGRVLGTVTVADTLRSETPEALTRVAQLGLRFHAISSADSRQTKDLATQAGLDDVPASLTPDEGAETVTALTRDGARVLTLGPLVQDAGLLPAAAERLGLREPSLAQLTMSIGAARSLRAAVRLGRGVAIALCLLGAVAALTFLPAALAPVWAVVAAAIGLLLAASGQPQTSLH